MWRLVTLGLVVSALSVAWGFTGVEGELRLRDQGLAFNDADQALDAAVTSRAHLGEAIRVAAFGTELAPEDITRVRDVALSLAEAELGEFEDRIGVMAVDAQDAELVDAADAYLAGAWKLVGALRSDDVGASDAIFSSEVEPRFKEVSGLLSGIRNEHLTAFTRRDAAGHVLGLITRFLLAAAVPVAAILVILDATRRRQAQRELELELTSQRELSKTKDEFIANVSHELRTPLTIVHGFATVLGEEEGLPAHVAEAAAFIAKESDELTRMVDDLLTAARTDADALMIRVEPVPIKWAIEAVLISVNQDGLPIEIDVEDAFVFADAFRLRQVIRNLLSNARKHGGPRIRVRGRVDGSHYSLTVVDDGPGVAPEIDERLFERFVHGAGNRLLMGSVGLGLAIVRSLVERMNGSITYERVDDETRFHVRLPLSPVGGGYRADEVFRSDLGAQA